MASGLKVATKKYAMYNSPFTNPSRLIPSKNTWNCLRLVNNRASLCARRRSFENLFTRFRFSSLWPCKTKIILLNNNFACKLPTGWPADRPAGRLSGYSPRRRRTWFDAFCWNDEQHGPLCYSANFRRRISTKILIILDVNPSCFHVYIYYLFYFVVKMSLSSQCCWCPVHSY